MKRNCERLLGHIRREAGVCRTLLAAVPDDEHADDALAAVALTLRDVLAAIRQAKAAIEQAAQAEPAGDFPP